jgi:hypothetical protein
VFTDFQSVTFHLAEKSASRQLDSEPGLCNFTLPYSRFIGHSAKTQIHLNGSMSALARYRQLRITSCLSVIRSELGASGSTVTLIHTKSLQPQLDDVSLELLRRAEQPIAVVHETICEQVHW